MHFNTPSKYMRDAFMFNLLRIFLETEKNVWCNATVDLLSGTIFVFDTDTQVYGQSRKQQMLQPQGVNTGICQMDTPSVAFLCTSNGWGVIHWLICWQPVWQGISFVSLPTMLPLSMCASERESKKKARRESESMSIRASVCIQIMFLKLCTYSVCDRV